MFKNRLFLILILISTVTFAQENQKSMSLQQFIEDLKTKNESIKVYDSINVMVNDVLIENHYDYKIDPKNIARMEILVIDPKKNTNAVKPSIIISTKVK